jgi:hypothetical protein
MPILHHYSTSLPRNIGQFKNHGLFKADFELYYTGSAMFKILFTIFVPKPTTLGIQVITKLDVAHQAPPATVGLYA